MTRDESKAILTQYNFFSRKAKAIKLKYQELERELIEAKGQSSEGERVQGGDHKSRTQRFAEMLDIKDKYEEMLLKSEKACQRTINLIENIYSKRTDIDNLKDSEKRILELSEIVMIYYYIDKMKIIDIMLQLNYSRPQVYRILKEGQNEFFKLIEDFDYSMVKDAIIGNENKQNYKYDTQLDNLLC